MGFLDRVTPRGRGARSRPGPSGGEEQKPATRDKAWRLAVCYPHARQQVDFVELDRRQAQSACDPHALLPIDFVRSYFQHACVRCGHHHSPAAAIKSVPARHPTASIPALRPSQRRRSFGAPEIRNAPASAAWGRPWGTPAGATCHRRSPP